MEVKIKSAVKILIATANVNAQTIMEGDDKSRGKSQNKSQKEIGMLIAKLERKIYEPEFYNKTINNLIYRQS